MYSGPLRGGCYRPEVVEATAGGAVSGSGIDVGTLVGGVPDHRGVCSAWDDVRTVAIERCEQTPGVLPGIIGPQPPEWDSLTVFVAAHQEQHIIFARSEERRVGKE